jgi:hypothetical protein
MDVAVKTDRMRKMLVTLLLFAVAFALALLFIPLYPKRFSWVSYWFCLPACFL